MLSLCVLWLESMDGVLRDPTDNFFFFGVISGSIRKFTAQDETESLQILRRWLDGDASLPTSIGLDAKIDFRGN